MQFLVFLFLLLFGMPMAGLMWLLPAPALQRVALIFAAAALLFLAALLLPRLVRPLFRRRGHRAVDDIVASLEWPRSLTRAEMENFCVAWLQRRRWQVSLSTEAENQAGDVYVLASRNGVRVAILCDRQGEALNPAAIRAFALGAASLEPSYRVLLTLLEGKLPTPAEAAAERAGVMLMRVPELGDLDELAKAAAVAA